MRRNASILVIDDEEIMREILEALLQREGHTVRLAASIYGHAGGGADGQIQGFSGWINSTRLPKGSLLIRFSSSGNQSSRTTRNPSRALVVSASADRRHAERTCVGPLAHEPPRMTRVRQPGLTQASPSAGARR